MKKIFCMALFLFLAAFQGAVAYTAPDPMTAGTLIRVVHVTELRTAINTARTDFGFATFSFTDSTLTAGTTRIRSIHMSELQSSVGAITSVYDVSGQCPSSMPSTPSWDSTTAGTSLIRASNINQVRTLLTALPSCQTCATESGRLCAWCNGSSGIAVQTNSQDLWSQCPDQACRGTNCSGSGYSCALQTSVKGYLCTDTCKYCNASGSCVAIPTGTDPYTDCGFCRACNSSSVCTTTAASGQNPHGDCSNACGMCDSSGGCVCKNDLSSCGSGKTCKGGTYASGCTCS